MYRIQCSYSDTNIDIKLSERVSILSDDSGIGKTFIVTGIKEALKVKEYGSILATREDENIVIDVLNDEDKEDEIIKTIRNTTGLVIIDEADKIFAANRGIIDELYNNKKAGFLIIMRGMFEGMYFSQKQFVRFEYSKTGINVSTFKSTSVGFFKEVN